MILPRPSQPAVTAVLQLIQKDMGAAYIITICMYCLKLLGVKDGRGMCGISHGMCPNCAVQGGAEILLHEQGRGE